MQRAEWVTRSMVCGMLACSCPNLTALTIEDIAVKNNKIIELDQEIAIAEKSKKLADIKSSSMQPETIVLPRPAAIRRDQTMAVISVHGASASPVVDVQYGDLVFQKKLGDVMPDGWQIAAIGSDSVTFRKKTNRNPELIKTLGIGLGNEPVSGNRAGGN